MPPWLILVLVVAAGVVLVGLQAAAVTGRWHAFWTGTRQYGTFVGVLAALGLLVAAIVYTLRIL